MNVNYDDERFTKVEQEKQNELNKYNQTYDNLIAERNELTQQQQNYVDSWKDTQTQIANDNLNHQLDLYNQEKEKAEKEYQNEAKASYIDYQKEVDRYGISRENMVSNGLSNSGYAESSKVDMYNTYQNRVATARESLNNIKLEFDNAIKEAQLSNNATLAELALQQMQQKLQIALEGFNYKDTQTQNKMNWEYNINNNYYDRYKDVENQINYENEQAEAIRQYNEQMAYQKEQAALAQQQWEKEYALQQQQLAYQKEQDAIANAQRWASINSSSSSSGSELTNGNNEQELDESNKTDSLGNNSNIINSSDYYFNGTDQPRYIANTKLSNSGKTAGDLGVTGNGIGSGYRIWGANGRYYVWNNNAKTYLDVTDEYKKATTKSTKGSGGNGAFGSTGGGSR